MTMIRKMEVAILEAFGSPTDRGEELRVTMNGLTLTGPEVICAALMAIRKPSEGMTQSEGVADAFADCNAALVAHYARTGVHPITNDPLPKAFTAMIDHILAGGE